MICDPVIVTEECLITIRRAFDEPGTYCINITLGDDTSQAHASALISVNGGESVQSRCGLCEQFLPVVIYLLRREHKKVHGSFSMPGGLS